jgi:hypothetical protein
MNEETNQTAGQPINLANYKYLPITPINQEVDYRLITERRMGVLFPKGLLRPTQREHS